ASRAEAPSADGRVPIPLDVDNRGGRVLRFVAQGVNDHAARDRAIGTDGARLGGAGDLQRAHLGARLGDVEAERDGATDCRRLEETAAGYFHGSPPEFLLQMSRTTMLPSGQECQREGRAGVPPAGKAASRRLRLEEDRTPQC